MAWEYREHRSPIRDLVDRLESDVSLLSRYITEQVAPINGSLTAPPVGSPSKADLSSMVPLKARGTPCMHDLSRADVMHLKGQTERMEVEIKTLVQFMDRMMHVFDDSTLHAAEGYDETTIASSYPPRQSPDTPRRTVAHSRRSVVLNTNQTYRYTGAGSRGSIVFRLSSHSPSSSFIRDGNDMPCSNEIENNGGEEEPVVVLDVLFETELGNESANNSVFQMDDIPPQEQDDQQGEVVSLDTLMNDMVSEGSNLSLNDPGEEKHWNDIFSQFMSIIDPDEMSSEVPPPPAPIEQSFSSPDSLPSLQWAASQSPTPDTLSLAARQLIGSSRPPPILKLDSNRIRATSSPSTSTLSLVMPRVRQETVATSPTAQLIPRPQLSKPPMYESGTDPSYRMRPHPPSSPSPTRMRSIQNVPDLSTLSPGPSPPTHNEPTNSSRSRPRTHATTTTTTTTVTQARTTSPDRDRASTRSPPTRKKSLANMLRLRAPSSMRLVQTPSRPHHVVMTNNISEPQVQYHTPIVAIPLNRSAAPSGTPVVVTFVSAVAPPTESPSPAAVSGGHVLEASLSSPPSTPSHVRPSSRPSKPLAPLEFDRANNEHVKGTSDKKEKKKEKAAKRASRTAAKEKAKQEKKEEKIRKKYSITMGEAKHQKKGCK